MHSDKSDEHEHEPLSPSRPVPSSTANDFDENKKKKAGHHHHKTVQYAVMQMLENAMEQNASPPANAKSPKKSKEDEANQNKNGSGEDKEPSAKVNHFDYAVDWNPTVAHECKGITGQPCKKPSETTVSQVNRQTARKNRRIVSSNIRRKKLIVWIVLFALMLVWNGFTDILMRLYEEDERTFSVSTIKPYLGPVLITEFTLTALGIFFMVIKMRFLRDKCISAVYRIITGLNNVQYLMAMIALPFIVYIFFTHISNEMKRTLVKTVWTQTPEPRWNVTQKERQCCGYYNRHDWAPGGSTKPAVEYVHDDNDDESSDPNRVIIYPPTCCNFTSSNKDGNLSVKVECTESSKRFWTKGCHNAEFYVVLDYIVCFVGLMFLAFVLNVIARVWIDKVERYLTIYRPYEIF